MPETAEDLLGQGEKSSSTVKKKTQMKPSDFYQCPLDSRRSTASQLKASHIKTLGIFVQTAQSSMSVLLDRREEREDTS